MFKVLTSFPSARFRRCRSCTIEKLYLHLVSCTSVIEQHGALIFLRNVKRKCRVSGSSAGCGRLQNGRLACEEQHANEGILANRVTRIACFLRPLSDNTPIRSAVMHLAKSGEAWLENRGTRGSVWSLLGDD